VPAVPDSDLARVGQFCHDRTPAYLRDEMRVDVGVRGKSVIIYDYRAP
jgi:hypothetical protein